MTEATSSRSSTFGQQYAGDLCPSLEVPEDILELLKESGWDNTEDLNSFRRKYTNMLLDGEKDPNLNIEKDLEMLKGLSSSLERKYYISLEESRQLRMKYQDKFQSLVKKLVERVPDIKDLPGYEDLTTEPEKFLIEQALQEKVQKFKLQVLDPALMFHLEDLLKELMPMDEKCKADGLRLQKIDRLRSMVDDLIPILATIKQSREEKVNSGRYGKRKIPASGRHGKRKIPASGRHESQKLVDRKVVEEGLLKVLMEVRGKKLERHVGDKFWKTWDNIVDGFVLFFDYLN